MVSPTVSVLHTSASLALNENWDPYVRDDMEMMLNKIVPEVCGSVCVCVCVWVWLCLSMGVLKAPFDLVILY